MIPTVQLDLDFSSATRSPCADHASLSDQRSDLPNVLAIAPVISLAERRTRVADGAISALYRQIVESVAHITR